MSGEPRLSRVAEERFLDPGQDLFLSLASVWEMAIKLSLEKLHLKRPLQEFIASETTSNNMVPARPHILARFAALQRARQQGALRTLQAVSREARRKV